MESVTAGSVTEVYSAVHRRHSLSQAVGTEMLLRHMQPDSQQIHAVTSSLIITCGVSPTHTRNADLCHAISCNCNNCHNVKSADKPESTRQLLQVSFAHFQLLEFYNQIDIIMVSTKTTKCHPQKTPKLH